MVLLLLACTQPQDLTCRAALAPNNTLAIELSWDFPGTASARFGETAELGQETPVFSDATTLPLIGNAPETEIFYELALESDGETSLCTGSLATGSLPELLPESTVSINDSETSTYVMGALFMLNAPGYLVAYRRDGTPVWYREEPVGGGVDFHYDVDGKGIWYNVFINGQQGNDGNYLQLVSLTGEPLEQHPAQQSHHMFAQLADGTLTYQHLDIRDYTPLGASGPEPWVGDAISEIAPDGSQGTVFSVWDWLSPEETENASELSFYPGTDWTHGNMIRYDEDSGEYLLSLGLAGDLLMIDRADFSLDRIYGVNGLAADPVFGHQHDPHFLENGNLLMFMSEGQRSGAMEYEVTEAGLVEVWRYGFERFSMALGQARRLENGNTLVNFGASRLLQEVTPEGEVVWEMSSQDGDPEVAFFGQFMLTSDLYSGTSQSPAR